MSGYYQRGGRNITRQMTEEESRLDGRVSAHLDAAPVQMTKSAGISMAYEWLAQDLDMRAAQTKQLAAEQQLAQQQGLLRALDDEARDKADKTRAAEDGLRSITKRLADPNADWRTIRADAFREDPSRLLNPIFLKGIQGLNEVYESPRQRELRDTTEKLNLLKTKSALDVLTEQSEQFDRPDSREYRRKMRELEMQTGYQDAELRSLNVANSLREAQEKKRMIDTYGANPQDPQSRAMIAGVMDDLGLGDDITDPTRVTDYLRGNDLALGMLADKSWTQRHLAEGGNQEAFSNAFKTLQTADPKSPEYSKARSTIDLIAYRHWRDNQDDIKYNEGLSKMDKVSEMMRKPFRETLKEISKIASKPDSGSSGILPKNKIPLILAQGRSYFQEFSGRGNDELVNKTLQQFDEASHGIKDPAKAVKLVQDLGSAFGRDFQEDRLTPPSEDPAADARKTAQRLMQKHNGDREKVKEEMRSMGYNIE